MSDLISRQAAIEALDEQIEQCDKALSSFDISMRDEFAVKAERASLVAFRETLEYLPPAEPKRGKWILDRSGAYCCSKCMEPCAGYVMTNEMYCKIKDFEQIRLRWHKQRPDWCPLLKKAEGREE